jgi:hypothetical protein
MTARSRRVRLTVPEWELLAEHYKIDPDPNRFGLCVVPYMCLRVSFSCVPKHAHTLSRSHELSTVLHSTCPHSIDM